jgi:hypothetical protein
VSSNCPISERESAVKQRQKKHIKQPKSKKIKNNPIKKKHTRLNTTDYFFANYAGLDFSPIIFFPKSRWFDVM